MLGYRWWLPGTAIVATTILVACTSKTPQPSPAKAPPPAAVSPTAEAVAEADTANTAATTGEPETTAGSETTGQDAQASAPRIRPRTVSTSSEHVCALTKEHTVACWGAGQQGQVAPGITGNQTTPHVVPGLTDVVQVQVAYRRSCALRRDGEIVCWGQEQPQLWRTRALGDAIDIAIDSYGSSLCALRRDQTIACTNKMLNNPAVPRKVAGIDDAIALDTRIFSTCALRANRELLCWKARSSLATAADIQPERIATDVVDAMSSGKSHCYETADGSQYCARVDTYRPVRSLRGPLWKAQLPPELWAEATDFSGDYAQSCIRDAKGQVKCWGKNRYGERGTGEVPYWETPKPVFAERSQVASMALGHGHTCVLLADHEIECIDNNRPWRNPGVAGVRTAAIAEDHACAIVGGGQLRCWGSNLWGELGVPGEPDQAVRVPGLSDAVHIAVGADHTCTALRNNKIYCWGGGDSGQLGDGRYLSEFSKNPEEHPEDPDEIVSHEPLEVKGVTGNIKALALGYGYSLALTDKGIYAWGLIPDPLTSAEHVFERPTLVAPGEFVDLQANGLSFCAIDSQRHLHCGGDVADQAGAVDNEAWLENEEDEDELEPFTFGGPLWPITTPGPIAEVAVGDDFACTRTEAGVVSCWGENRVGQLGLGHTRPVSAPASPMGVQNAVELAASTHHVCARTTSSILCWGSGLDTQTELKPLEAVAAKLPPIVPPMRGPDR